MLAERRGEAHRNGGSKSQRREGNGHSVKKSQEADNTDHVGVLL